MRSMFVLFVLAVVVFIAVVGVAVIAALIRGSRRSAPRYDVPPQRAEARVVDKRSQVTGGGESRAVQHYFVTFEFPDGNRLELEVAGPESGLLTHGDSGLLDWQGTRYLGFAREILR